MIESEIIERNNALIESYQNIYKSNKKPIAVKFREIIPELKGADRYTHLIHAYPAKLLVHIPYFFLNNSILSKVGDNILDPFNGTGTVYLESLLAGRNAFGADSNPLARLISKVKSTKYDTSVLTEVLDQIVNQALSSADQCLPEVVNCDLWFPKRSKVDLSKILFQINEIKDENIRNFMLVSFSNCVKKVSYADPRISVPVKLNAQKYEDKPELKERTIKRINEINTVNIFEKFKTVASDNIKRFKKLENTNIKSYQSNYVSRDARRLFNCDKEQSPLPNASIQLIITSPPYAGAQKYIRSSSLNLGWTGLAKVSDLSKLDKKNIGRDIYNKNEIEIVSTGIEAADLLIEKIKLINISRANIACKYLIEMKKAIDEMIRVLKKDGNLVLVIGNNKICGFEFNTQEYLTDYILNKGLNLKFKLIDDIASYGLMTKRNKTADIISREYILVFNK